jgi:uncharacterized protein YlxW (UPF0749 family)
MRGASVTAADASASTPQPPRSQRVPSLLRSLLNDHLDPGYAGRARNRTAAVPRGRARAWLAVGGIVMGAVLGVGWGQTRDRAPDAAQVRTALQNEATAAHARVDSLSARRAELRAQVGAARAAALQGDEQGRRVLEQLSQVELLAGAVPVTGPGITATISEPAEQPDLSGGGAAQPGATILDRDLQQVVNALFAAGAEAIAIGNIRIGPGTAIRQAGGAIFVDNQPVLPPYVIAAVGPARQLQSKFIASEAFVRMSAVSQLYGAGFVVKEAAELTLPAAALREPVLAQEGP